MIIGVTGTLVAGKTTTVDFLKKKGFKHYSAREFLVEHIRERGLPVNRDTMTSVGNDLRKVHGASYVIEKLYERAKKDGGNAVIESIRTPGEVKSLQGKGDFVLIGVTADPKIRYERAYARGSETDKITYERFLADEEREMSSTEEHKQNLSKCLEMADYLVDNSGTIEEYMDNLKKIYDRLCSKG